MDIPIPPTIPTPENTYYKEIILKKEGPRIWTEYYAVLCDQYIVFNRRDSHSATFLENNCTILHLEPKATVAYSPKTCYRFPFYIRIGKLTYHFKCETNLQRYRWVCALRLAIARKAPEPPPKYIPTRYSRGKLAKKEDKLSLKAIKFAGTARGQNSAHPVRANGHVNGHCARSSGHSGSSDEENELQHSSNAVRLYKSKDSLLLTNKAAVKDDESDGNSVWSISDARKASSVVDDLEIVDLDGSDHFKADAAENTFHWGTQERSSNKSSNSSQAKKKVLINDEPTDMEDFSSRIVTHNRNLVDGMDNMKVGDDVQNREGKTYRVYPDNVKSFSWTSLGIMRKQQPVTRRENSAPPATRRERIMNRKNAVDKV